MAQIPRKRILSLNSMVELSMTSRVLPWPGDHVSKHHKNGEETLPRHSELAIMPTVKELHFSITIRSLEFGFTWSHEGVKLIPIMG
jgi:hypothetical protein